MLLLSQLIVLLKMDFDQLMVGVQVGVVQTIGSAQGLAILMVKPIKIHLVAATDISDFTQIGAETKEHMGQ